MTDLNQIPQFHPRLTPASVSKSWGVAHAFVSSPLSIPFALIVKLTCCTLLFRPGPVAASSAYSPTLKEDRQTRSCNDRGTNQACSLIRWLAFLVPQWRAQRGPSEGYAVRLIRSVVQEPGRSSAPALVNRKLSQRWVYNQNRRLICVGIKKENQKDREGIVNRKNNKKAKSRRRAQKSSRAARGSVPRTSRR